MNPPPPTKVIQSLAGVLKALKLYPLGHPAIDNNLGNLSRSLSALQEGEKAVRIGLLEGSLFLDDHLFVDEPPAAEEIGRILRALSLEGLEFRPGVSQEELLSLLELLTEGRLEGEALAEALADRQVSRILVLLPEPETGPPRKVYGKALKVVDGIFRDVRLGRIPSSAEATEVVKDMVRLTLADPHALLALSMLKNYDDYTFTHSVNVSVIALAVGRACGLDEKELRALGLGGMLHDLGKLKIDLGIITKPGRLTDEEFEEIRSHPGRGAAIVRKMQGLPSVVADMVLGHHLRYDRKGYPIDSGGLSPLADMVAIADTYDAMTTLRSYQRPMTPRRAAARLQELKGTVLHPEFVDRFTDSLGKYPVGSLVRLDSCEIALVTCVGTLEQDRIDLKIIIDAAGKKLDPPLPAELRGEESRRIVAEVDPLLKGIEVTDYFE